MWKPEYRQAAKHDGLRKGTQVDFIGSEEARDAKAHQKKARQRSHRR
jgi:hypothetical protein